MKRLPVYAGLLVVLALIVLLGGMDLGTGATSESDPARITDYRADFRVDDDGVLHARETITVDFPIYPARHGIFRFFDRRDPNAPYERRRPHDIAVTRQGHNEPYDVLTEGHHRYSTIKIGSAESTVSGSNVYVIEYTMKDALLPRDDGERSRFYWDLVPAGWQMDIAQARLTVHLPANPEDVACHQGAGQVGGCTASLTEPRTLVVSTGFLPAHTPITLSTELDVPTPPAKDRHLWPARFDGVLGDNVLLLAVVAVLGAIAALFGLKVARTTREKDPGFPILYAPPEGVGPAQAAYILRERVGKEQFVASLMQAAEQQQVSFHPDGDTWRLGPPDGAPVGRLDEVTDSVVDGLGARQKTFTAKPDSVKSGRRLKHALESFDNDVKQWARRGSLMESSALGHGGGLLLIGAFIAAGWLAFQQPLPGSIWAIVPGLFGVFVHETALPGAGTRRTPQGRELWSKVGGFHRILSTPSAEARFDFAARKDLYTTYLPWAVAFGCAEAWAQKYRVEVGQEPPAPRYWAGGYNGVHTGAYVSQMVDSFDRTVDSAISSYQATQRSSSSGGSGGGGGGGFGGGGGGGGGGGSW